MKINSEKSGIIIVCCIIVLFSFFALLPSDFKEMMEDALIDLQFKIRGQRDLSDEIIVVYIGADDINALDGWPISRDYYGYMIHVLKSTGVRTIGLDIFFDRPDIYYPEFDKIFVEFLKSAGNVCLPMTFAEVSLTDTQSTKLSCMNGLNPSFPYSGFEDAATSIGFSNFGKDSRLRKVPLIAVYQDSLYSSFGFTLARHFSGLKDSVALRDGAVAVFDSSGNEFEIPVDHCGRIRLNHFADIDNVTTLSFVDLLQNYETIPLRGKLALIAVTAPGIATLRSTPFTQTLPASLIHATCAENLIRQNFLKDSSVVIELLLIALLSITIWFAFRMKKGLSITISCLTLLLAFWIIAMFTFVHFAYIIPILLPMAAFGSTMIYCMIVRTLIQRSNAVSMKKMFEQQIAIKEQQLKKARQQLTEMREQWQRESSVSEELERMADNRKLAILQLEKELSDLKTYMIPAEHDKTSVAEFMQIVHAKKSAMAGVLKLVTTVSRDDIPVLITGETGTGKEMIARAIHESSTRRKAPFIAVNCGALSETLLESELFGHERGSFTGAHARRKGRFELASGGTIFLDEITETTTAFQSRLLRVLQEGAFERLGGEQTISVDVRIIAATNQNLNELLAKGNFRADLYYRLNGFPIHIPPLRERAADIPILAVHFLKKHDYYENVSAFSGRAMEIMQLSHWTGNVRELENVVRRAAIFAQSEGRTIIRESDLPKEILNQRADAAFQPFEMQVLDALRSFQFTRSAISQTAKALGNRDRGTITEYFRGICFEHLVHKNFDVNRAARSVAASTDENIIERVKNKMTEYMDNLEKLATDEEVTEESITKLASPFKGLPKKFHPYLQQVLEHLAKL